MMNFASKMMVMVCSYTCLLDDLFCCKKSFCEHKTVVFNRKIIIVIPKQSHLSCIDQAIRQQRQLRQLLAERLKFIVF